MKLFSAVTSLSLWAALMSASMANAQTIYTENFESGATGWTGKNGGAHTGALVADPLHAGNTVLSFTALTGGGDVFSDPALSLTPGVDYSFSFDYLGLAQPNSVADHLGGYIGLTDALSGGHYVWAGGTGGGLDNLADDGQWRTYTYNFTALPGQLVNPIRITAQDWDVAQGVAGDVYFDNLRLSVRPADVPEPGTVALLVGAGCLGVALRRRRK